MPSKTRRTPTPPAQAAAKPAPAAKRPAAAKRSRKPALAPATAPAVPPVAPALGAAAEAAPPQASAVAPAPAPTAASAGTGPATGNTQPAPALNALFNPVHTARRKTRSGGGASFTVQQLQDADLLEVQFADGSVYYTHPADFQAQLPRSARSTRSAPAPDDTVELPFELGPPGGGTRSGEGGDGALQVDQYSLSRLTPPTWLDGAFGLASQLGDALRGWWGAPKDSRTADTIAPLLCRAFENKVLDARLGQADGLLLYWDTMANAWQPAVGASLPQQPQVLVLLHGTASSTEGSFSGLWQQPDRNGPAGVQADFARLAQGRLLLAFEHRSLTVSPLRNVLDLLQALQALPLPAGCSLSLLSHSRGGLLGELLSAVLGAELGLDDRRRLADVVQEAYPADHAERPLAEAYAAQLVQLGGRWAAGTFVRVACPARGTLLADRRTDLFLSLLLRALGVVVGGIGNPWYEALQGLVRSLVATRAKASVLPGLEAMIPGCPLSRALNLPLGGLVLPGKLRVVAGDSKSLGWGGVLTLLGDVFYGLHDHDFVVHTHSMFGGLPRRDALSLRVEDKTVTHFGYFRAGSMTRLPVLAALASQGSATGADWRAIADDEARTRGFLQLLKNRHSRRTAQDWVRLVQASGQRKPIVVVLPGIMGSELSVDLGGQAAETPVWLALRTLLGGDLTRLQLRGQAPGLVPSGMMAVAYERLLDQASSRYHVVAMPYDWRLPLPVLGDQLFALLSTQLLPEAQRLGRPLHILAHSMGGLVARAALFWNGPGAATPEQRQALWAAIGRTDGRLVMLGTPNQGSYAPAQLLLQQHQMASLVAAAAAGVSGADLARYGAGFPGLLSMLPAEPDAQFASLFDMQAWARMAAADRRLVQPDPAVLAQARQARQWLDQSFAALKADPRVLYVAGQGSTPVGFDDLAASPPGTLRLRSSAEGDGTVPWNSTLLPERTWYVPSTHGDLPDRTSAFAGYFELLDQGNTTQLARQKPSTRGLVPEGSVYSVPELPSLPADPAGYVLGVTGSAGERWSPPIAVRVVHGSLDYARYPLMVGHYHNDSLMGAVQRVNRKLGGQLQRMVDLKLFVGAARTAAYLRPPTAGQAEPAYPGAVVLGLGAVGDLTPATLAHIVTRGVLRYAFEHAYQDPWVQREGVLELRLSTLLIGTHVQAVGVRDSLASVLQGVWRASQLLADDTALARCVRVAEVEVVEIDENTALDAAYQLSRLLARAEWKPRFTWSPAVLESRDGGLRGYRPSAADSIWQRLCITQDDNGAMRFELIAERARVESTRVHAAVASLGDYIARVSDAGATGDGDPEEQASLGRVLYQLLLPQALKSRLLNFEQTVLVLDDESAKLPWELLTPPMADSLGQDSAMPLAVQAGMVRQRVTTEFRGLPGVPAGRDALVIGAPLTSGWTNKRGEELRFADLPGAEREATQVAGLLQSQQWTTKLLPAGSRFERVRTALYERPWRVLHLCGHGVVDQFVGLAAGGQQELKRTGMVLNNQQVLTAGDVEQMDPCPEFVFINCCYSGRESDTADIQRNAPVLAASLALQFIRMGAKAVVAAGWQVDDADGFTFADALYRRLLDGDPFGEAVREARKAVHAQGGQRGPRSNTWGAYQCYGDHLWRLVPQGAGGAAGDPGGGTGTGSAGGDAVSLGGGGGSSSGGGGGVIGSGPLAGAERCMSKHELAARILQVAAVAGDKPSALLEQQLDALIAALRADDDRREWLRSSRVRASIGEAYRELGAHLKAVTWLQRAAKTAYSRLELRHLEMGVNSLSRLGADDQSPPDDGSDGAPLPEQPDARHPDITLSGSPQASHRIANALLDVLDQLDQLDASGLKIEEESAEEHAASSASERLCLRASDSMRQAATSGDPARRASLLLMAARDYCAGYNGKVKRSDLPERRAYALSSALVCAGLALLGGQERQAALTRELLRQPLEQASGWAEATQGMLEEMERAALGATFWHYTNIMDLLLARQVLAIGLDDPRVLQEQAPASDLPRVLDLLDRALVRWPAPVEVDSLSHRWSFIVELADGATLATDAHRQRRVDLLQMLKQASDRVAALRPGDPAVP